MTAAFAVSAFVLLLLLRTLLLRASGERHGNDEPERDGQWRDYSYHGKASTAREYLVRMNQRTSAAKPALLGCDAQGNSGNFSRRNLEISQ
ncbi:MAG: hypothetical protein P8Y53_04980 [Pseudolabrys sp.]|jgi:hypothetical protein